MATRSGRKPRRIWKMLLLGVLTVGSIALGGCGSEPDGAVVPPELLELEADGVIYGMRSVVTVEGIREGLVQADTAFFYQDSARVELRGVELTVYDEDGRSRATVTSDRGWLNYDTNEMLARGNAVLTVSVDNRVIESAELNYEPNAGRIWSDSTTVQTLDGVVTEGSSFESDLEFRNVVIHNMRTRGGAVRF